MFLILDNNYVLEHKDYLYVPKSSKDLIMVSSLCKLNYLVFFFLNKRVFIKLHDSFIYSRSLIDNLYHVSLLSILPSNENYNVSYKRKKLSTNQTQL